MLMQHSITTALLGVASASAAGSNILDNADWRNKIQHVVVLVEENRSFDTFAGGLTYNPSIDGLLHTKYCNSL